MIVSIPSEVFALVMCVFPLMLSGIVSSLALLKSTVINFAAPIKSIKTKFITLMAAGRSLCS